jgi:hypothetical protein
MWRGVRVERRSGACKGLAPKVEVSFDEDEVDPEPCHDG